MDYSDIWQLWTGRSPTVKAALIGACATMASALVASFVVFLQIGRQSRKAIEQAKNNEALRLRVDLYKEKLGVYHVAAGATTDLSGLVRSIHWALLNSRALADEGFQPSPPKYRFPDLMDLRAKADSAWIKTVFLIEDWIVVDVRMDIFRIAFAAANFEIERRMAKYADLTMRLLPAAKPGSLSGELFPWSCPPTETIEAVRVAGEELIDALSERTCYLVDFRTEMQNLLVSDLFSGKAPAREPIDPRHKVISLAKFAELKKYFENDTEFGAHTHKIETDVRSGLTPDKK